MYKSEGGGGVNHQFVIKCAMSGKDTVHEIMPNNPQALAKKKKKKKKLNFIHSLKSLKPHSYTCQDRNAISVSLVSLPNYKELKWALDSS